MQLVSHVAADADPVDSPAVTTAALAHFDTTAAETKKR